MNKIDKKNVLSLKDRHILVSAKNNENIEDIKEAIYQEFQTGTIDTSGVILTNVLSSRRLSIACCFPI